MKLLTLLTPLVSLILTASPSRAFELGGLRVGNTPARAIVRESSIKGKCVQGQCLPYALDLAKRLQAAGIPAQVIGYRYGELMGGARDWGQVSGHAVVVYQDGGRTYIMDNQSWTPRWVEHAPDKGMALQYEGMNSQVVMTWKVNGTSSPTRFSKHYGNSGHREASVHSSTRKGPGNKVES